MFRSHRGEWARGVVAKVGGPDSSDSRESMGWAAVTTVDKEGQAKQHDNNGKTGRARWHEQWQK
jgi:hypothetical protein